MTRVPHKIVSVAKASVRPLARRVPPGRGPRLLVRTSRDARVAHARRVLQTDPADALALLERELPVPGTPTDVWRLAARAASRAGDRERTVELDLRAVERGYATVGDCLRLFRLTRTEDDGERASVALRHLVGLTARNQREVARAAEVLRRADPEGTRAFAEQSVARRPTLDVEPLYAAADEAELVAEARRSGDLKRVVDRVVAERTSPHALVIRALTAARQWEMLRDHVGAMDEGDAAAVPPATWATTARRAATSGWTDLAGVAARQTLERSPTVDGMQLIVDQAGDLARVLSHGWSFPERRAVDHAVDSRSVVAVLGQSLPLRSGGYATRSHGILTSLAHRGWTLNAVTRLGFPYDLWWDVDDTRTVPPVDMVDGVPYHRLVPDGAAAYPRSPLAPYVDRGAEGIAALVREVGAGLVHASSLYDVGMAGLVAARRTGVPFVYEMRGLKQLLEGARITDFVGSPQEAYLDALEGAVAREADAVLVITRALGDRMVELGVDPNRISVVSNGVHVDRFTPRPRDEELAAELGVAGKKVIGYVGGLVHYEGLDVLFRAVERLSTPRDDFHVLIVGDGAHERALHQLVTDLDLAGQVTFTGRVPHDDVERYLSLVDIAPFPRLPLPVCELISPIKPFEAMAMEKAVVVSDVAALAEIVTDGRTGRVFAKGDPASLAGVLDELLADDRQRSGLGSAARSSGCCRARLGSDHRHRRPRLPPAAAGLTGTVSGRSVTVGREHCVVDHPVALAVTRPVTLLGHPGSRGRGDLLTPVGVLGQLGQHLDQ